MSKELDKIRKRIKDSMLELAEQTYLAAVTSVDADQRICNVEIEEVEYEDVRLYSVANAELKGFVILPKVGSQVLVSRIGNSNEMFVSMFSVVDILELNIEGATLKIDAKGFALVREQNSLKKTLEAMIDAITKMTVTTQMGQSGTPINVADFVKIKQELNNYLTE